MSKTTPPTLVAIVPFDKGVRPEDQPGFDQIEDRTIVVRCRTQAERDALLAEAVDRVGPFDICADTPVAVVRKIADIPDLNPESASRPPADAITAALRTVRRGQR